MSVLCRIIHVVQFWGQKCSAIILGKNKLIRLARSVVLNRGAAEP